MDIIIHILCCIMFAAAVTVPISMLDSLLVFLSKFFFERCKLEKNALNVFLMLALAIDVVIMTSLGLVAAGYALAKFAGLIA